jgi:hypothetical protein
VRNQRQVVRKWRAGTLGALLASAGFLAACGAGETRPLEFRQMSDSFYFTVTSNPIPPRARETVLYKIVVRDKESRQPIETGIGRIYSSNRDQAQTWDGLTKGAEVGTYYAKLNFVASGDWAIAIEFRRDSTARIEKVEWMQDVRAAREPGT